MTVAPMQKVDPDRDPLQTHKTRLPTWLYPLSFCPPIPSLWRHPILFAKHPIPLYILGVISALVAGACLPASGIVYGWWTNGVTAADGTADSKLDRSSTAGWIMTLIGVLAFFTSWLFLWCFATASDVITLHLRRAYVSSVLVQDQAFFDSHGPGEVASRAGKDINTIRACYGEKMGYVFWSVGTLIASIIPSFCLPGTARLSGVIISVIPFTLAIIWVSSYLIHTSSAPISTLEGRASSLVEQILSSIRIAQTFSMESSLVKKFDEAFLSRLERLGRTRALARAFEQAGVYFALFLTFSLSFWMSGIEIVNGVQVGYALTCFWNMINALFALANVLPHIASLADAAVALTTLRRQIERRPFIDIRDPSGITLPTEKHALQLRGGTADSDLAVKGQSDWKPEFELRNVTFAYPSRPAVKSLDDVSLRIEPGKMTAFVGHSGSGKSTTVGLLLREYDPETGNLRNPSDEDTGLEEDTIQGLADDGEVVSGEDEKHDEAQTAKQSRLGGLFGAKDKSGDLEKASRKEAEERSRVQGSGTVLFAGRDIREYNLQWYRQQISVVSQAPQLFSTSIFGNVAAGLTGTEFEYRPERDTLDSDDAGTRERMAMIRELVEDALRKAQAWEFVSRLPEGMDTVITGGRAQLLSGGQRQRVALARALVSKPAVLLLDEATSALDTASEDKIRKMLEIEQKERGMSLIVVAHRMSTIVSADKIFVMQSGKVVDEGTYNELLETDRKDQTFRNMVLANQEQQRADTVDEKIAYENNLNGITADDQSGIFSNTSTVGILPEGSGMSTPPNLSINRSNSTGTKRPDLHMLYSGRGSNFGRMDHTIDGPVGMAGTVNPPVAEEDEASEGSSPSDEKPDAMDAQRPDPLKPRRYSKGALLKSYWRIMAGRKWWFLLGVVCSIAAGAGWPIEGWMVGEGVHVLSIEGDPQAVRQGANRWALWFLVLAIADFAVLVVNGVSFELVSESVVRIVKRESMRSLLKQETGFFESNEESDAGALTAALSSKPTEITAASGLILSQILIAVANLIGSMILGFVLSWKVTVVALPPVLVTFFSGWLNVYFIDKYEAQNSGPASRCASFLSETVDVVRTVTNLNYQRASLRSFDKHNLVTKRTSLYLNLGSIGFSISQAMIILLQALLFYWGGKLTAEEGLSTVALFASFEAIIIASFASSRLLLFVGDVGRAFSGMAVVQSWFDRKPVIANIASNPANEKQNHDLYVGDIVLSNIELRYPRRPEHPALKNVSLTIKSGQTHAFCGSSGSGKSSLLALLLRFYEPCKGQVTFGGRDSRSIPLKELRSRCAYVSQDPQLFEGTIRWNLCLGAVNAGQVTQEALEEACDQACILDFIRGLKDGFETEIGMKGAALSGGQRQRLCIARALIRKPEILFLDEATSALDATSELQVNKALANASKGRTTITIAHRLSTIRAADVIHVIEDGRVKEEGSHDELIKRRGRYVELVEAQM